jgi:hypothetical protein
MIIQCTQSAADVATVVTQALPISRVPQKGGKATVMEILAIDWTRDTVLVGAESLTYCTLSTANNVQAITAADTSAPSLNPTIVDSYMERSAEFTAVGIEYRIYPVKHQMNDGAGHGILVATDNLYLTVQSDNSGEVQKFTAKIFYRFKNVTLTEYIGIVQSQSH